MGIFFMWMFQYRAYVICSPQRYLGLEDKGKTIIRERVFRGRKYYLLYF